MMAARLALCSLLAVGGLADEGYEVLFESSPAAFEACSPLPNASLLKPLIGGMFLQPSIGQFEMHNISFTAGLDAFGKIHKVSFHEASVCASGKMLTSRFYEESLAGSTIAPGLFFADTEPPTRRCPLLKPLCPVAASADRSVTEDRSRRHVGNMEGAPNDNVFVNTVQVGVDESKLFAITDSPMWQELDPASLNLTGLHAWDKGLTPLMSGAILGSAHPVPLPGGGAVVDYQTEKGAAGVKVRVYAVNASDASERRELAAFTPSDYLPEATKLAWMPYVHSFGVLPDAAVLPLSPMHVELEPMVTSGLMESAFADIMNSSVIVVAPFDGAAEPVAFATAGPSYFLHALNTFRDGREIVFDSTVASTDPFRGPNIRLATQRNKTARDAFVGAGDVNLRVVRFRLHADTGAVTEETLSAAGRSTDFTKINFNFFGRSYCYYWGCEWAHDGASYGSMAIVKRDICGGGATYWHRDGWFPGEPTFVADEAGGGGEDAGLLIFVALHGATKTSSLVVVDAGSMATVYELQLPEFVPFPTHGEFYAFTA